MVESAEKLMSAAEFLDWDDGTDTRYELIGRRPVAMPPAAPAHSVVANNIGSALKGSVGKPCYVATEAGVMLPDRGDTFYEADIVVSCTPLKPGMRAIPEPVLIAEVLSPSTTQRDRGIKLYDYRHMHSVHSILLASSEDRRVEVWQRRDGKWEVEDLIGDAVVRLAALRIDLALAEIYADSGI